MLLIPVIFGCLLVFGYWRWLRAQVLFRIEIHGGKQTVTRGHVPLSLLNDFSPVVRGVQQGEIRAHKEPDGARLSFGGDVDAGVAQQVRNVFALFPAARLRKR